MAAKKCCHGATVVEPSKKCTGWDIYNSKERPWIIRYTSLNLMDDNLYHGEMGGNHQTSISNCFLSSISIYIRATDVELCWTQKSWKNALFLGGRFLLCTWIWNNPNELRGAPAWRIISVGKWLQGSPPFISHGVRPFGRGTEQPDP